MFPAGARHAFEPENVHRQRDAESQSIHLSLKWLKTTPTDGLLVSVGQDLGTAYVEDPWSHLSHEAAVEVLTRVGVSSSGSTGKGSASKLTYVDVGSFKSSRAIGLKALAAC